MTDIEKLQERLCVAARSYTRASASAAPIVSLRPLNSAAMHLAAGKLAAAGHGDAAKALHVLAALEIAP